MTEVMVRVCMYGKGEGGEQGEEGRGGGIRERKEGGEG